MMAVISRNTAARIRGRRDSLRLCLGMLLFLPIFLFCPPKTASATVDLSEDQLKAAFIFNFIKFVQWPAEVDDSSELNVYAFGESAVAELLFSFAGKKAKGRVIRVRRAE